MAKAFIRGLHNLAPSGSGPGVGAFRAGEPDADGVVATIGTFDGIHRGHQAIMQQVRERAAELALPAMAMIFEPHPREFFFHEQAPARLMRLREKIEAIRETGIEQIFCLHFNRVLRAMTARDFIERVLVNGARVRCLIVGDDFRFGCDRAGNIDMLEKAGAEFGFEVIDTATVEHGGCRISSTWVREALEAGDFALAEALLGRPFSISGKVVHGNKLGRELGVPTANINLQRHRAPLSGVFVANVVHNGARLPAVANVGVRPTVGGLIKPILEVHLLRWQGDIYGCRLKVEFLEKIREERRFSGKEELVENILRDIETANSYFARWGP